MRRAPLGLASFGLPGLGLRASRALARNLHPSAQAIFDAMATPPSAGEKSRINTFLNTLETAGVWDEISYLSVGVDADAKADQLFNWKNPAQVGTETGTLPFTADHGVTASATNRIDTGLAVNTLVGLNDQMVGIFTATEGQNANAIIANAASTNFRLILRNASNQFGARLGVNTAAISTATMSTAIGLSVAQRINSTTVQFYRNGVKHGNDVSSSSSSVPTDNLCIGVPTTSDSRLINAAFVGSFLTADQHLALYNALMAFAESAGILLAPLGFSGAMSEDVASTVAITGTRTGSTLSVQSGSLPTGMSLDSAGREIDGTPTTAGTGSVVIRETLADHLNTPRDTTWNWSVAVTLDALTLSADEWTVGTPSDGTIDGDTAGSSISVSGTLPTGLTIDTTARTWDWDGTGSVSTGSFDLVETHADASNSPRTSTISWGIVDVPDDFDAHIVMLGDSIGDQAFNGWSAIENLGYASTTVSNLSLGGKTLSTWLTDVQAGDIDAEYDPDRPCFAIIQAGTNDIFSGGGLTGAALSVVAASLIALVKEKGFYAVLVPLIARENANSTWQGYRTDYNNWCLGGETGADLVVDMTDDPIVGDDADFDLTYWEDEDPVLHPNQPGQENIRDIYKYPENLPSILGSEPREPAPPPSGGDIDPLTGSGVSYATGTFGQARSTGGLTVPTTVFPVPVATERTVTMWCKRDTAPSSLEVIIGVDDNDYLAWDGTGLTGTFGSTSISTATWHHIAIEWGAVYFRVYLDGTRVFQTTVMPNGNRQLEIGQYYGSYNFGGLIDQIEVWDSALYNDVGFTPPSAPVTGGTAGLIGAYRLDGDLVGYQA